VKKFTSLEWFEAGHNVHLCVTPKQNCLFTRMSYFSNWCSGLIFNPYLKQLSMNQCNCRSYHCFWYARTQTLLIIYFILIDTMDIFYCITKLHINKMRVEICNIYNINNRKRLYNEWCLTLSENTVFCIMKYQLLLVIQILVVFLNLIICST